MSAGVPGLCFRCAGFTAVFFLIIGVATEIMAALHHRNTYRVYLTGSTISINKQNYTVSRDIL